MSSDPARPDQARTVRARFTAPPAPRPRWLRRGPLDLVFAADVLIAVIATGLTISSLGNHNALHLSLIHI